MFKGHAWDFFPCDLSIPIFFLFIYSIVNFYLLFVAVLFMLGKLAIACSFPSLLSIISFCLFYFMS